MSFISVGTWDRSPSQAVDAEHRAVDESDWSRRFASGSHARIPRMSCHRPWSARSLVSLAATVDLESPEADSDPMSYRRTDRACCCAAQRSPAEPDSVSQNLRIGIATRTCRSCWDSARSPSAERMSCLGTEQIRIGWESERTRTAAVAPEWQAAPVTGAAVIVSSPTC